MVFEELLRYMSGNSVLFQHIIHIYNHVVDILHYDTSDA